MSGNSNHVREALALCADELSALRYLEHILWPNGVCCPRCGHHGKAGKLNGASTRVGTYKCYGCRKTCVGCCRAVPRGAEEPQHRSRGEKPPARHLTKQRLRKCHSSLQDEGPGK